MTRQLDTPINESSVTTQRVVSGRYVLNIIGGSVDLPTSFYEYYVDSYYQDGSLKESKKKRVFAPNMPLPFKTKLKELHSMVVTHAENEGLLHPGVDSDDL